MTAHGNHENRNYRFTKLSKYKVYDNITLQVDH